MITRSRYRPLAWSAAALALLAPWLAMRFTDQVAWDVTDFAVFGALLVGAGLVVGIVGACLARFRSRGLAVPPRGTGDRGPHLVTVTAVPVIIPGPAVT